MTNSLWVTLLYFFARQSHPMTNSMWVTLLYFFARQSHQSCLIGSEWHCSMTLPGSLINHISSHDQQYVSDTALSPCQADSSISLPMINREWVTLWLLYFFARQSHQSCLIPWPTACEWHCFISLPGSLINHVSSYDQQEVSDIALFPCQGVSSVMSHHMTNSLWVTLLYFFARQSHQSCLIPWPTGCEWHCYILLSGSLINHVSQGVSDTALFLCKSVSSIMSHPMTNSQWVSLLYFFARQSHQSCLIGSEWYCFISLPGSLINHVSSHN